VCAYHRISFPYTTFKPVPGAVLSTGFLRKPRRACSVTSHGRRRVSTHTRTLRYTSCTWRIHRGLVVREGYRRSVFDSIRASIAKFPQNIYAYLCVWTYNVLLRPILCRRTLDRFLWSDLNYILLQYYIDEDEWSFRVYEYIRRYTAAVLKYMDIRLDSNLNARGRGTT